MNQPAASPASQPSAQLSVTIHKVIAVDLSHQPVCEPCTLLAWVTTEGQSGRMTPLAWDTEIQLHCPMRSPESSNLEPTLRSQLRSGATDVPTSLPIPITISVLNQDLFEEPCCGQTQTAIATAELWKKVQQIQLHYNPDTNLFMGSGVIGRPGKPVFYISPYDSKHTLRQFQIWFSLAWQTPDAV